MPDGTQKKSQADDAERPLVWALRARLANNVVGRVPADLAEANEANEAPKWQTSHKTRARCKFMKPKAGLPGITTRKQY